ncbi:hypothetical protein [Pseudomonas fluorescens]|uniref:Uncharacterized protein n=1 Tax=Pseudomonas fluorescens TaxID=294 RepID=A0A5E7EQL2_PSEFL|nr:hypothetical protein [Pseudomonas fluorescens]VVO29351.1 hypothetical protein PS691_04813 [Pseudomonas fluorescens]
MDIRDCFTGDNVTLITRHSGLNNGISCRSGYIRQIDKAAEKLVLASHFGHEAWSIEFEAIVRCDRWRAKHTSQYLWPYHRKPGRPVV